MKTILLTGAAGFLGSHVLKKLLEKNFNVIAVKRTATDIKRIKDISARVKFYDIDKLNPEKIYKENKIDIIIHTAVCYGRNNETADEVELSNIVFPLKLFELGMKNGVKLFINSDTFTKPDYGRLKYYTLTKKHFTEWLQILKDKTIVYNLVIHQMYGDADNDDKFIPFVIKNMLKNVKSLDFTKGEQKRDFIYIDDVCDAFIKVIENHNNKVGFNQFEIGTGKSTSIKEIVLLIKKISGRKDVLLNFGALPYTQNEEMNIKAKTDDILKELKWKYKTTINDGLLKTFNWYKENMEY
ncbi:MAG: NAD(P)-dependent oxidoreductase [Spirochaetes bacterium]|nr:NAD(P)-dependent oxidoreductase [Spirochaetota bacterium]